MKFEVGSWYYFTIEKVSCIPEKGDHYVLKHESDRKMLLNAQHYVKYNFKIGQTIECRVDKVNCTGQIFLEPRHPSYDEGSTYFFKILGISNNADNSFSIIVKDSLDNKIQVFLMNNFELDDLEHVALKVEKIKKGFPILTYPRDQEIGCISNYYETITLKVVAIISENTEEYYSLGNDSGRLISRLKVKHYSHYGLKIGSNCHCIIIGYNSNGLMLVEPENPWYKIGENYIFKINSIESYIDLDGNEVRSAIVLDKVNNKCGVVFSVERLVQIETQNEVKCKVIGFRKGRPQLEIDLY